MNEHDDLENLRRDYARLPREAPDAATDGAIRAAARRHVSRRRLPLAFAAAAVVALAAVIVPALLFNAPPGEKTQRTAAEQTAREEALQTVQRQRAARESMEPVAAVAQDAPAAAPPAPAARLPEDNNARLLQDNKESELERVAHERARLHAEEEALWRARLLALRAEGQEEVARQLLVEFRARFGYPDSWTLDDLAREESVRN